MSMWIVGRIIGILFLLGFLMEGCQLKDRQDEISERERLIDSIRYADSLAAQPDIDSLIHLTDSIQGLLEGDTVQVEE